MQDQLLTTRQLAERWGVAPGTLQNQRSLGRSPLPFVRFGKVVRYRLADVLDHEEASLVLPRRAAA